MAQLVEISPFDQASHRLYVHKFLCFAFPDAALRQVALDHLNERVVEAALRWPFVAGRVVPVTGRNGQKLVELRFDAPGPDTLARDIVTKKVVPSSEFAWTYEQLAAAGVPPKAMQMATFSSVPEWPEDGVTYPALAIQANFINGGLILCIAFHHVVADGGSFTTFIKDLGATDKTPRQGSSYQPTTPPRLAYLPAEEGKDILPLNSFPEYNCANTWMRAPSEPDNATTTIIQFTAASVKVLEAAVSAELKRTVAPDAWVSSIGCVSSLIWVAVVRARRSRLFPDELAKIGTAVNVRGVIEPKQLDEYFGNLIVHVLAVEKVSDLVNDDTSANPSTVQSAIPISVVARAAYTMRQAVATVNSTYVNDRLRTFSALSDPSDVNYFYDRAIDSGNSGIDFSSWRDQGPDVEYGIPGTASKKMDFWRKAWSPNEGAYNILPRKGGSGGNALWEVSLGLSKEDMAAVCSPQELGAFAERILKE